MSDIMNDVTAPIETMTVENLGQERYAQIIKVHQEICQELNVSYNHDRYVAALAEEQVEPKDIMQAVKENNFYSTSYSPDDIERAGEKVSLAKQHIHEKIAPYINALHVATSPALTLFGDNLDTKVIREKGQGHNYSMIGQLEARLYSNIDDPLKKRSYSLTASN